MDRVVDADMCDSTGYDCWTDAGVKLHETIDVLFLLPLNINLAEAFIIILAIYIEHIVRAYDQLAFTPHLHVTSNIIRLVHMSLCGRSVKLPQKILDAKKATPDSNSNLLHKRRRKALLRRGIAQPWNTEK